MTKKLYYNNKNLKKLLTIPEDAIELYCYNIQ